jgi:serine/threonine protein kinase
MQLVPLHTGRDVASTFCGTPVYMSPEIINKRGYSHGCDVWALGCVAYELLALHHPFAENVRDMQHLHRMINDGAPPLPAGVRCCSQVRRLLGSMLAKTASVRPSMAAVLTHPALRAATQRALSAAAREAASALELRPARRTPRTTARCCTAWYDRRRGSASRLNKPTYRKRGTCTWLRLPRPSTSISSSNSRVPHLRCRLVGRRPARRRCRAGARPARPRRPRRPRSPRRGERRPPPRAPRRKRRHRGRRVQARWDAGLLARESRRRSRSVPIR